VLKDEHSVKMPTASNMQYTIRGIPKEADASLRSQAERRGMRLNQPLVEGLREISQLEAPGEHRSLDFLRGHWREDPEFDAALAVQHQLTLLTRDKHFESLLQVGLWR
jgi:hypothetical protein